MNLSWSVTVEWLKFGGLVVAGLIVALVASRTVQAAYYETSIYCAWAWWDWFC